MHRRAFFAAAAALVATPTVRRAYSFIWAPRTNEYNELLGEIMRRNPDALVSPTMEQMRAMSFSSQTVWGFGDSITMVALRPNEAGFKLLAIGDPTLAVL